MKIIKLHFQLINSKHMKIYFAFIMFINYLLFSCLILMLAFDVNESQFNLTNSQTILSAVLSFMFITVSSIELNK